MQTLAKNDSPSGDLRIVVMGVSGCGKTTVAQALAERLQLQMVDGDDLHLSASIQKMSTGIALQDEDRWPWLDRIGQFLARAQADTAGRVVACSALKRAYRERIRAHAPGVVFVYLHGQPDLIRERMTQRVGHYMQPGLLDSQLQTLEAPAADEADVLRLDIDQAIGSVVVAALQALAAHPSPPLIDHTQATRL